MFTPLPAPGDSLDLHVSLRHIGPTIWRALSVPATMSLAALHEVLQVAFGWKNCHLHDFHVGDIRFAMPSKEDEMFCVDEGAAPLGAVARPGSTFVYQYDFGDDMLPLGVLLVADPVVLHPPRRRQLPEDLYQQRRAQGRSIFEEGSVAESST